MWKKVSIKSWQSRDKGQHWAHDTGRRQTKHRKFKCMVWINKHIYTLYTSLSCINRSEQTIRDMKQQCEANKNPS
jgi:hypothetical protein